MVLNYMSRKNVDYVIYVNENNERRVNAENNSIHLKGLRSVYNDQDVVIRQRI